MVLAVSVSATVGRSVYTTLGSRVTIGYPDWVRLPHGRIALQTWVLQVRPACLCLSRSNPRQWTLRRQTRAYSKGRCGATPRAYMVCPLQESAHSVVQPRPRPGSVHRPCGNAQTPYGRPRQEGGYDCLRHGDPEGECLGRPAYGHLYHCHPGSGTRAG